MKDIHTGTREMITPKKVQNYRLKRNENLANFFKLFAMTKV